MLVLYHAGLTTCSKQVRFCLREKGLAYESRYVDLLKFEHLYPDYLKLNPHGVVPTLVHDGHAVINSACINEYLDEEYPIPALMPEDSQSRAQVRTLEDYCDNSFIPPTTVLLAQALKPEGERDEQRVEQAREELRHCLYYLREKLDGKQYLVGNQFTLADAAFAPRMIVLGRLGFEFEPALAPVQQWVERIRARPSVASLGL